MDQKKPSTNDLPRDSDLFGLEQYIEPKPKCPTGGTYTIGTLGELPRCPIPTHTLNSNATPAFFDYQHLK